MIEQLYFKLPSERYPTHSRLFSRECEVLHTSLLIPPSRTSEFGRCHEGERWHGNQIASHLGSPWLLHWR
jgi:hypothetical protein